jgi:drug/metabolite transporter (DMT)-like permease
MGLLKTSFSPAMLGHLAMLLFSILVAGSFSLGSMVANEIAPGALNAVRFGIAAFVIWVLVMATGGVPKGSWKAPWRYVILGAVFGAYFVLMFEGLKTAPPVSAAAVFTLTPILAAGFGWLLLRQVLTARMALALLIGGLGALWVIFRADLSAALAFEIGRGEMIYFIGVICHAIYTPLVRKLNRGESARVFSLGVLVAGCLVITLFSWSDIWATDWTGLRPMVWITILYVSVFASASTFVLTQFATLRLPSAKVMAYTYLVPSWVILWELALGNGAPVALVLVGVGMTIAALAMLLRE